MRNASLTLPNYRPVRVTNYTSGSGTFTPETVGNLALIELQGAGGGGGKSAAGADVRGASGGAAGLYLPILITLIGATYSYIVGALGAGASSAGSGAAGGYSGFGTIYAPGGPGGVQLAGNAIGGVLGSMFGAVDNTPSIAVTGVGLLGMSGGFGGAGGNGVIGGNGGPPCNPYYNSFLPLVGGAVGGNVVGGYGGGGAGGTSPHGLGGNGGNGNNAGAGVAGAAATGYGAGGGGGGGGSTAGGNGGNGTGGFLRITEWRVA